jgi:Holliday junction resolvasome RuvABC endonuclease subunit
VKIKEFGPGVTAGIKVYVGIDQSYSGFGLTLLGEDSSWRSTVAKFDHTGANRLMQAYTHVYDSLEMYKLQEIAMEGYAYGSQMANMAGELGGIVKLCLKAEFDRLPLIVPPTTLKKYVTGRGSGNTKSTMMLKVFQAWKVELLDDNAADSYGLARIASGYATTKAQREVLDLLKDPKHRA